MTHKTPAEQEDAVTWYIMQGDDVKRPMIENSEQLEPRQRRRMKKLFSWTSTRLEEDGFDSTMRELRSRGMLPEHVEALLHEVISGMPRLDDHEEIEEFIEVLPEDREAVDMMQKVG